jgi:hypothetical protein
VVVVIGFLVSDADPPASVVADPAEAQVLPPSVEAHSVTVAGLTSPPPPDRVSVVDKVTDRPAPMLVGVAFIVRVLVRRVTVTVAFGDVDAPSDASPAKRHW